MYMYVRVYIICTHMYVCTVNQLIFESEKVSKVLEKPFRKLFNFEKSRGVCTGFNLYSNVGIARR